MKRTTVAFFAGCFGTAAVNSLVQDYMGLEAWQAMEQTHWRSSSWTVSVALMLLVLTWFMLGWADNSKKLS